jgi:hypothetical protein
LGLDAVTFLHRAAGLCIAAHERIPGLPPAGAEGQIDVRIHLGAPAPWQHSSSRHFHASDYVDEHGRPIIVVARHADGFHFSYADGTMIWLDSNAANVWCTWPASATLEDTATYLTGPILGFALRLRGALALHASAVVVNSRALVLVGPHGAGKSTTAAALGRRGCAVITDDVLHLRRTQGAWMAEVFAGDLRLWPEGAALALGGSASLPRITPGWNKRALDARSHGLRPALEPVLAGGIVLLTGRDDSRQAPALHPVRQSDALVALAAHSSASHLLDAAGRAREFEALEAVVRHLPCMQATAATSPDAFESFIDLVYDWAHAVTDGD